MNEKVEKILNEQIKHEEHSSRIYLAMASWCEKNGFNGASKFLYSHAEEEREHMQKLIHYINDRGGHALMEALEKPETEYKNLKGVFEKVLKHEQFITNKINKCYEVAITEKDYNTAQFLSWYIDEQVEEESTMSSILDDIKLAGEATGGLFHIDRELRDLSTKVNSND